MIRTARIVLALLSQERDDTTCKKETLILKKSTVYATNRDREYRRLAGEELTRISVTIVSQPSKCLKFMTFQEGYLSYPIERKYFSEALETFYHH